MSSPSLREDPMSQLPAVELLINLSWEYLTPSEALEERGGRRRGVILERVLRDQLRKINRSSYREKTLSFSDAGVEAAIDALTNVKDDNPRAKPGSKPKAKKKAKSKMSDAGRARIAESQKKRWAAKKKADKAAAK